MTPSPLQPPAPREKGSLSDGDLFSSAFAADVTPAQSRQLFRRMNPTKTRPQPPQHFPPRQQQQPSVGGTRERVSSTVSAKTLTERRPSLEFLPFRGGNSYDDQPRRAGSSSSSSGGTLIEIEGLKGGQRTTADVSGVKMIEVKASPLMRSLAQLQRMFPELHSGATTSSTNEQYFLTDPYATCAFHDTNGLGPVRFTFTTSEYSDYDDVGVTAAMQIRVVLDFASFVESSDCASIIDATDGFPGLSTCYFSTREMKVQLQKRLKRGKRYSFTVLMRMPGIELPDSEGNFNSFSLIIEYYQLRYIEQTKSPLALTKLVKLNADTYGASNTNGWVTEFTLRSQESYQAGDIQLMTFALKTVGTMNSAYSIDIIAHPTDKWRLGTPGAACQGYTTKRFISGSSCLLRSYPGSDGTQANGFRLVIDSPPAQDHSSEFQVRIPNPTEAVNMVWVAISLRDSNLDVDRYAHSVLLDRPVHVAASSQQWVTLEFYPGNTIQPLRPIRGSAVTYAGSIIIEPPRGFKIVDSVPPQAVEGKDAVVGLWTSSASDNFWQLKIVQTTAFKDTQFTVKLMVENPAEASSATSWKLIDATEPFPNIIAATRDVRGFPIYAEMTATLAHSNQVLSAANVIRFTLTPMQYLGHVENAKMIITAPRGFTIQKRCPKFNPVEMPEVVCKGNEGRQMTLTFPQPASVTAGETMIFDVEFMNPSSTPPSSENLWYVYTVRPDGIGADVTKIQGFELYPKEFATFAVAPKSRYQGNRDVVIRFSPAETIPYDDYLRIRAPESINWYTGDATGDAAAIAAALAFSSAAADTSAVGMLTSDPIMEPLTPNVLAFRVLEQLQAGFEYGFKAVATVPSEAPVSNRWWLEHYRLTGDVEEPFLYIASMGGQGFRTQVLSEVSVTPYSSVEEAWENPTTIVFETSSDVSTIPAQGAASSRRAELLVQGPPGFTFICPLKNVEIAVGDSITQHLPEDRECSVLHSVESERNKLHVYFDNPDAGLKADTRYAFIVDMVNSLYVNPTSNYFKLSTRIGGQVVEEKTIEGFQLTKRMSDTRYISLPTREDRRAGATDNLVTFVMGLTVDAPAGGLLVLIAPKGFSLVRNGYTRSCEIEEASGMGTRYAEFPALDELTCRCPVNDYTAELTIPRVLPKGDYAIQARVSNPLVTPEHNFWNILIKDEDNPRGTIMSESWIDGMVIQEILNPRIVPYNAANAIPGEAAPNPIDIFFTTTTLLPNSRSDPNGGLIMVTAPQGFYFPAVCRYFTTTIQVDEANGGALLPPGTTCQGDGVRTVTVRTPTGTFLDPGTYGFRVLIENPSAPFEDFKTEDKKWELKTLLSDGTMVDYNGAAYGFPVRHRARYFFIQALSQVGLYRTVVKISFSIYETLPPQANITIITPDTLTVDAAAGLPCVYPTPEQIENAIPGTDPNTLVNSQDIRADFGQSLLSDAAQLPGYISCKVVSSNVIVLKNEEEARTGRPLLAGPTYEQILTNVMNPQSTPELNLWRMEAHTVRENAPETWATTGYIILPELADVSVVSSNPAYGLFTTFTFSLTPITRIPESGSILIHAPVEGYYFGPRLVDPTVERDLLSTIPPPAGGTMPRPPVDQDIECSILAPIEAEGEWTCPFSFTPCLKVEAIQLQRLQTPDVAVEDSSAYQRACDELQQLCDNADFHGPTFQLGNDRILHCVSSGGRLEITLGITTLLEKDIPLSFSVTGYNADLPTSGEAQAAQIDNLWNFVTRDSDSSKTILDRKTSVGFDQLGVIYVDLISPDQTKVSVSDNIVEVHLRLSTQVNPPARLAITYPPEFARDSATVREVTTSGDFPRKVDWRFSGNQLQIDSKDEPLRRDVQLILRMTVSNPHISPPDEFNIWRFETLSLNPLNLYNKSDVNYDVSGFKIYGSFRRAEIASRVSSPAVENTVGIWFVLESDLPREDENPTSYLRIWFPPGFAPVDASCGLRSFNLEYQRYVGTDSFFPLTKNFVALPAGSLCESGMDTKKNLMYVELLVDKNLEYGLDYGFQDVPGFELKLLHTAKIDAEKTNQREPLNLLTFTLKSIKILPGNTVVMVDGPPGFVFTCAFVSYVNLGPTTTCTPDANKVQFQFDALDQKEANEEFQIKVYVRNPQFTPQPNTWDFRLLSPLGLFIDIRLGVQGFDITGLVEVTIAPEFTYKRQRNNIAVAFLPSTIMNRADIGNEIVVTAPSGFTFPINCSHFDMKPEASVIPGYEIPEDYVFPPVGTTCRGSDNVLTIRFPAGAGLQRYRYLMRVDVINAKSNANRSIIDADPPFWTFRTRVNNEQVFRIVDANMTVPGFWVTDLVIPQIGAAASPPPSQLSLLMSLSVAILAFM
ncbi:hypothetical protein FOL47_006115 [Perkinsus chesapeaki]|uniref:Uncharacterized protein n=1 Tax=Perkinsus chesapeaki TaxID=330153 RepID=A0A7J6MYR2_PERCH|nr:hypothetical protein FOL47_006115 [Perkinsus chesapeaki]